MVADEFLCHLIQLEGRNTRLDMFCQFRKCRANESVCLAHQLDFVLGLKKYIHFFRSNQ